MPEIGDILADKYRLERLVGQGGMGAVYEATHIELNKRVAVKIPNAELAEKTQELRRFEREPRLAAATGHRGIVDIYDVGTTPDGLPFVVMEYLQGETLAGRLQREKRLDVPLATSVVAQVLSALDAAHRKKIVHRDLKPDNVFLIDTGQPVPEVKILDFGTSKAYEGELATKSLTKSGTVLGTPYYLAPEQIRDEEALDHRADIYAVGVMFYETLTGKRPYSAENVYTLVHKVLNDDLVPPRERRKEIPEGIEDVVLRALSREPGDRFSSASSMLAALLPFLDDMALGRVSLPEALRGEGGKAKVLSASTPTVETPLTATKPARPSAMRKGPGRLAALVVALVVVGGGIALWAGMSARDSAPAEPVHQATLAAAPGPDAAAEPEAGVVPDLEAGPAPTKEAGPSPAQALVTLELAGVPEGAVVTLDGARLRKTRISVRPSPEARELRVRVDGEDVLREMVTLEENTRVDVAERVEAFAAKAAATAKRPPTKRPRPVETTGPTKEPTPPVETKRPPAKGTGLDFTDEWRPEKGSRPASDGREE